MLKELKTPEAPLMKAKVTDLVSSLNEKSRLFQVLVVETVEALK
jgi:hypothetical protein